jgi:uncharacterized protein YcgL (UPF0745 family)
MRYCVYPNPIRGTSGCLIVPEDTQITDLPGNIQGRFGEAKPHRFIELNPRMKYAGLDVSEVLRSIAQKGYHNVGIPIPTMEQWPGQPADA